MAASEILLATALAGGAVAAALTAIRDRRRAPKQDPVPHTNRYIGLVNGEGPILVVDADEILRMAWKEKSPDDPYVDVSIRYRNGVVDDIKLKPEVATILAKAVAQRLLSKG